MHSGGLFDLPKDKDLQEFAGSNNPLLSPDGQWVRMTTTGLMDMMTLYSVDLLESKDVSVLSPIGLLPLALSTPANSQHHPDPT